MGTYMVYAYLQQTRFKCKKKKDDYFEMLKGFCGSLENLTSPPAFHTGITDTALGLTIQQHACATQAHLAIPTLNSALIKENTVRQNRQLNCGNQWHLLWKVAQLLQAFNLKGRWNLLLLNCFPSQHCSSHYILIPLFRFLGAQPSVLMWNWWLDGHCICLSTVWQQIRRKGRDKKAEIYRHFNKNVLEDSSWP